MDIYLLSQLIKEILPAKGRLSLPRIGVFGTESVPAHFSENGRVIYPPTRKILFSSEPDPSDTTLLDEYASKIGVPVSELEQQSDQFFSSLLSEKARTGCITFPGLGKVDFTGEAAAFIPEEGTDIFCERYSLEPLNLKKKEEDAEEDYCILPDTFQDFWTQQSVPSGRRPGSQARAARPEKAVENPHKEVPGQVTAEPRREAHGPATAESRREAPGSVAAEPGKGASGPVTAAVPEPVPTPVREPVPAKPEESVLPKAISYPDPSVSSAPAKASSPVQPLSPAQAPSPARASSPAPAKATSPSKAPLPAAPKKKHRGWTVALSIILGVFLVAAALIYLGREGYLDTLLYSEEELRLIESAGAGR